MQQQTHTWDAALYNHKHSFVYDYGASLIELLDPKPHERILDLGCGSGELTKAISEHAKDVIGIDKSAEMVERARLQFPLCDYEIGDASDFNFHEPFDAIFSNATLHWVVNYKDAIDCMYANLKKEGRIVVEFGGKDNVRIITEQLRKSLLKRGYEEQAKMQLWYFPSVGEYASALEAANFTVTFAQWYDRPTQLFDEESGIKDWLSMFCKPFLNGVNDLEVVDIMNEVQKELVPTLFRDGKWFADYKRIRVVAFKK